MALVSHRHSLKPLAFYRQTCMTDTGSNWSAFGCPVTPYLVLCPPHLPHSHLYTSGRGSGRSWVNQLLLRGPSQETPPPGATWRRTPVGGDPGSSPQNSPRSRICPWRVRRGQRCRARAEGRRQRQELPESPGSHAHRLPKPYELWLQCRYWENKMQVTIIMIIYS